MEVPKGQSIGKFSPDGNYLVLSADTDLRFGAEQKVELINLINTKSLWLYNGFDNNQSIDSFDVSNDGDYIIVSLRENPNIENKKVLLFSKTGKIVFEKPYVSKDKKINNIKVSIDEEGKSFNLIHGNTVEGFDIIE